jgi:general secretion pathway protein N
MEPARAGNPLWSIPLSALSATRDRPLFSASRRRPASAAAASPPPRDPAPMQPPAPEAPPFALVGTIIGGDRNIAILVNEESKSSVGVREGEGQSGWTLVSVDRRTAVLEGGGRRVILDLPTPDSQAGAPPAPPAPEAGAFPVPEAEGAAPSRAAGAARRRNSPSGNDDGR